MKLKCFPFWCYSVLPLVYTPGLTDYDVLCKAIDYINKLIDSDKQLSDQLAAQGASIEDLQEDISQINQELQKIQDGTYLDLYLAQMLEAVKNWVDKNLPGIIGAAVKFVQFGLTPNGFFCADIPENWNFLKFDTIMDPSSELFGHLVLCY